MPSGDYIVYQAISGLSEEEMQLDATMSLDCNNCFKPIPKWILEDAGDVFFLGDYECEHCFEPLG
tara:strand:- start:26 stop:220 length:195 start_codon:yes stop_codon:yes gene_type:complete